MKYLKFFENFEYEEIELPEEEYLYIQPSQIKNAGNGLFTSIDIECGEIISKFKGEVISDEEAKRRAYLGDDDYFMNLPSGETLDCKRTDCFAKFANDAEGIPSNFENNSIITMDDDNNVVLLSDRDIKSGEEIFVGYGKSYWKINKYRVN
jgi:SET domain-containing protein